MKNKTQVMFGWGQKYTISQLSAALRIHKGEVLEICRRIACDETGANKLLEGLEDNLKNKDSNKRPELRLVETEEDGFIEAHGLEDEVNLIQLLAEVHLMAVVNNTGRRSRGS